ncbi:YicC family protein [Virgibacillus profundi]|uniref:YicC family protein n=1 Tax=Virgibacillus profundi TaxID=2024555 RepID=A0A2A2IFP6_9BACI|nr:YicC/YloC family endoribonuclease [Virgibacillus profundi]PAV29945.1 YicC family protein [Virgibacillus profundi]PXY54117.1 YicC family protein [Virgibacillus profundi]
MGVSMTGYGSSTENIGDTAITVEIRSVNHRYLDFSAKIPRSFLFLEDKIKRIIQSYFERGRIEVYIEIAGDRFVQKNLQTDWDLMDQFINQINTAKDRYHLSGELPATILTALPEMITVQEIEQQPDDLNASILSNTELACIQVLKMREEEGAFLLKDLKERIASIENTVLLLQNRRTNVIEEYRRRIQKRIEEQLIDTVSIDHARLHQEIVLLAEKGDITEEITRLLSHVDHFMETINKSGAIGRKLDFIVQEMHREANTIGSKSTDPEISESTVLLKGEIERIKEQLQNIE